MLHAMFMHSACVDSVLHGSRHPFMRFGWTEGAEALVKAGAKVNGNLPGTWTPLHFACAESRLEVARFLLQCGADPDNAENETHSTPLHFATKLSSPSKVWQKILIIRLLMDSGANASCCDRRGRTPLDNAEVSFSQLSRLWHSEV
ncbi:ankyrin repeat and SOCS box protein 9-like [Oratosquilla oratoria]|uniref:ankyrin repeat and SOCS box protein 9-like n=1 Tax=Oratosquilla oratoria TaxID=337810 RepID=UPI003F772673